MNRLATLTMSLAPLLIVASCAMPGKFAGSTVRCNPGICKIEVNVSNCAITLDKPDVVVYERLHIEWEVNAHDGRDYEFTKSGIFIPHPDFEDANVGSIGKKFKILDKHDSTGPGNGFPVKYFVTVRQVGGATCPSHDPTISNQ